MSGVSVNRDEDVTLLNYHDFTIAVNNITLCNSYGEVISNAIELICMMLPMKYSLNDLGKELINKRLTDILLLMAQEESRMTEGDIDIAEKQAEYQQQLNIVVRTSLVANTVFKFSQNRLCYLGVDYQSYFSAASLKKSSFCTTLYPYDYNVPTIFSYDISFPAKIMCCHKVEVNPRHSIFFIIQVFDDLTLDSYSEEDWCIKYHAVLAPNGEGYMQKGVVTYTSNLKVLNLNKAGAESQEPTQIFQHDNQWSPCENSVFIQREVLPVLREGGVKTFYSQLELTAINQRIETIHLCVHVDAKETRWLVSFLSKYYQHLTEPAVQYGDEIKAYPQVADAFIAFFRLTNFRTRGALSVDSSQEANSDNDSLIPDTELVLIQQVTAQVSQIKLSMNQVNHCPEFCFLLICYLTVYDIPSSISDDLRGRVMELVHGLIMRSNRADIQLDMIEEMGHVEWNEDLHVSFSHLNEQFARGICINYTEMYNYFAGSRFSAEGLWIVRAFGEYGGGHYFCLMNYKNRLYVLDASRRDTPVVHCMTSVDDNYNEEFFRVFLMYPKFYFVPFLLDCHMHLIGVFLLEQPSQTVSHEIVRQAPLLRVSQQYFPMPPLVCDAMFNRRHGLFFHRDVILDRLHRQWLVDHRNDSLVARRAYDMRYGLIPFPKYRV